MKFSTRARYGLRMMIELAKAEQDEELVHLGKIARVTGLSNNYLAQLAISLKNNGLLIGVSGQRGGYQLARLPREITVREILEAVIGPINITECAAHPEICLYSSFCESRAVFVLVNGRIQATLDEFTLADLLDRRWLPRMRQEHADIPFLDPDRFMADASGFEPPGCPRRKP